MSGIWRNPDEESIDELRRRWEMAWNADQGRPAMVLASSATYLPVSDELLDDIPPPDPNRCDIFRGDPCFIHTFFSWGCAGS